MEWSRLKRAKRCRRCDRGFEDGEEYQTFLHLVEEMIEREDYCIDCARALGSTQRPGSLSRWRGRYKTEPVKKNEEEMIGKSMVERLLRKYLHSDDPAHVNVRYILALMMERRKKLIARDTINRPDNSKRIIVYELSQSGETFLIEDPGLEISQARAVQKQVRELLESEGVKFENPKTRNR